MLVSKETLTDKKVKELIALGYTIIHVGPNYKNVIEIKKKLKEENNGKPVAGN